MREETLSWDDFVGFASVMSFADEAAVSEFMYHVCDLDGDGKVSADDLGLFVLLLCNISCQICRKNLCWWRNSPIRSKL